MVNFDSAAEAISKVQLQAIKGLKVPPQDPLEIHTSPMSPEPHNFYARRISKFGAMAEVSRSIQTGSTFSKTPGETVAPEIRVKTPQAWRAPTHSRLPSNDKLAALLFPTISSASSRKNSCHDTHRESSGGFDSIMSAHGKRTKSAVGLVNTFSSEQIEQLEKQHCYDSASSDNESSFF